MHVKRPVIGKLGVYSLSSTSTLYGGQPCDPPTVLSPRTTSYNTLYILLYKNVLCTYLITACTEYKINSGLGELGASEVCATLRLPPPTNVAK